MEQDEKIDKDIKERKKEKRKRFVIKIIIFLVMLTISIATSSMNLTQMGENFFFSIFNYTMGTSKTSESTDNSIQVKGKHVEIRANDIYRVRQIFEILGMDNSQDYAIKELEKVKTLSYYGEKSGFAITESDIEDYISECKQKLKDSNEYKYNTIIKETGSEKGYWKVMKALVKEKLMADRTLAEKRTEILKQNDNSDVDTKLSEYTDTLLEREEFKVIMNK